MTVHPDDLEKSIDLVAKTVAEDGIGAFKVIRRPFSDMNQLGKNFTIYFAPNQDKPEIVKRFMDKLEQRLRAANVRTTLRGKNLQLGDRPIQGSKYASYRYEFLDGVATPRDSFMAPRTGDFMDNVSVKTPVVKALNQSWYNDKSWRTIGGKKVLDNIDKMDDVSRTVLEDFLKRNNIAYESTNLRHRNDSVTKGIKINGSHREFEKALKREANIRASGGKSSAKQHPTKKIEGKPRPRQTFNKPRKILKCQAVTH